MIEVTSVVIPLRSEVSLSVVVLTDLAFASYSFRKSLCLVMMLSTRFVVASMAVELALVSKLVSTDLVLASRPATLEDRREERVVISVDLP